MQVESETVRLTGANAKTLSVQSQRGEVSLWYECDTPADAIGSTDIIFYYVFTGRIIHPMATKYVGTVQQHGGDLVYHIYTNEKTEPKK